MAPSFGPQLAVRNWSKFSMPFSPSMSVIQPASELCCIAQPEIPKMIAASAMKRFIGASPDWCLPWRAISLVRLWQAENAFRDIAEDQLRRDRRDPSHQRFAQVTFDVVFGGIAVAAVGHHRLLAGVEARFPGEVLGGVGLGAARLARVVERGGLEGHEACRL